MTFPKLGEAGFRALCRSRVFQQASLETVRSKLHQKELEDKPKRKPPESGETALFQLRQSNQAAPVDQFAERFRAQVKPGVQIQRAEKMQRTPETWNRIFHLTSSLSGALTQEVTDDIDGLDLFLKRAIGTAQDHHRSCPPLITCHESSG